MIHPRKGVMLCYPFEEKRLTKWTPPYIVQPKINGIRAVWNGITKELVSSQTNVFKQLPTITKALQDYKIMLDGELYCHGMPLENIQSITSQQFTVHPNEHQLRYYIFDIIHPTKTMYERFQYLYTALWNVSLPLYIVPTFSCGSLMEIEAFFDSFIADGYEGIIIRNKDALYEMKKSTNIMKWKLRLTDGFKIISYIEEVSIHGERKDALGALVCITTQGGDIFNVGTGFTREERIDLWKRKNSLTGRKCLIAYPELTSDRNVPRHPVFKGFVEV